MSLAGGDNNSLAGFLCATSTIGFFPLYHFSPFLAFSFFFAALVTATLLWGDQNVAGPAVAEAAESPFVQLWRYIVSSYEDLMREVPPNAARDWPANLDGRATCAHHPTLCECFDIRQQLNQRIAEIQRDHEIVANGLAQRDLELAAAVKARDWLQLQVDDCQYFHSNPDEGFVQLQYRDGLRGELEGQRRKVYALEIERDQLTRQAKDYRIAIEKLQAQVNWARGAGEDKTQAQFMLDQERAKNRELTKRVNDQGFKIMQINQQLANEKESHSEKCKDSSGCQRMIRDLREKLQRVVDLHQEYEIWVRNAAVNFGMAPEQAQRLTLEQYIELLSQYVVQQHAKNTPGFDVKSLTHMFRGNTSAAEIAYRERLESEVKRLGGNIVAVRIGLDTSRPSTYKIKAQTYEENFQRVFPIYEALVKKVLVLTKAFTDNGVELPVWYREKNLYFHEPWVYLGTPQNDKKFLVSKADHGKSPNSEYLEAATERLVRAEVQRWYNRGLLLLTIAKYNLKLKTLPPAPYIALEKIKKELDPLLTLCLRQVLDDLRPLSRSPDSAPSPRLVKKFEIYKAMKAAVFGQTQIILDEKRELPDWDYIYAHHDFPGQLDTYINSTDLLAKTLLRLEIYTLFGRVLQLDEFMELNNITGASVKPGFFGAKFPGHIAEQPLFEQSWRTIVAIQFWARIAIHHWNWHDGQNPTIVVDPETGLQRTILDPVDMNYPSLDIDLYGRSKALWGHFRERGWNPIGWNAEKGNWHVNIVTTDKDKDKKKPYHNNVLTDAEVNRIGADIRFNQLSFAPWMEWKHRLMPGQLAGDNWGFYHFYKIPPPPPIDVHKKSEEEEKQALRDALEAMQMRVKQLDYHVQFYDIRQGLPPYHINPVMIRKNASRENMEKHMNECQGWERVLRQRLVDRQKYVPEPVSKGGVYDPQNTGKRFPS